MTTERHLKVQNPHSHLYDQLLDLFCLNNKYKYIYMDVYLKFTETQEEIIRDTTMVVLTKHQSKHRFHLLLKFTISNQK